MLCALSFSRQSKTISCQSTKRDEERERSRVRSLSQFAEYDVEREGERWNEHGCNDAVQSGGKRK